jgi:hypothetical protein
LNLILCSIFIDYNSLFAYKMVTRGFAGDRLDSRHAYIGNDWIWAPQFDNPAVRIISSVSFHLCIVRFIFAVSFHLRCIVSSVSWDTFKTSLRYDTQR